MLSLGIMSKIRKIDGDILRQFSKIERKKSGLDLLNHLSIPAASVTALNIDGIIKDIRDNLDSLQGEETISPIYIEDKNSLDIMRHSMAHLMAQAVQILYPQAKLGRGPTTENGFFYDFDLGNDKTLSFNDLKKIENLMRSLVQDNIPIEKQIVTKEKGEEIMRARGEKYKLEILSSIENQEISLYSQGDFIDLCRGPHIYETGAIGTHFSLTNVSSVSWKASEEDNQTNINQMQRIYAVGFANQEDLEDYFNIIKSHELLDHRKIGVQNNFFTFQSQYCSGGVFWEEKGFIIYREIVEYIRKIILNNGYFEVKTPVLYNDELWKASGHWYHYRENMFSIVKERDINSSHQNDDSEENIHYICPKPMNCPAHITLFKSRNRSYRDLPMRMAEFGCCFRNEPSGSLNGLMRMREFIQDDAHIFCEFAQVKEETKNFCLLLQEVYHHFGFKEIGVVISTRPEKSFGTKENWEKAEKSLMDAIDNLKWPYTISHGDGAFYGPKLEFTLRDRIGRKWQCGTFQLDFVLAERMGAKFTNDQSQEETPIICHRAILGSVERFLGILIENNAGCFPFWLSPVQISILPISEKQNLYSQEIQAILRENYRCYLDQSNQTLQKKIKNSINQKIPLIIIIGQEEMENKKITIRNIKGSSHSILLDDIINQIPIIIQELTE